MDLLLLGAPFKTEDIEWRIQQSGKNGEKIWAMALAYITNRAIMARLDEVCGVAKWCNEYKAGPDGGILCGISIKTDDGWVTKWDGAQNTDIEAVKGGLSNSMKRAGAQWGIGRYLYKIPTSFVTCDPDIRKYPNRGKLKDDTTYSWQAPQLPAWATYNGSGEKPDVSKEPTPWHPKEQSKFLQMCKAAKMGENSISGFELYLVDRAKMPHMTSVMAQAVFKHFNMYLADFNEWSKE